MECASWFHSGCENDPDRPYVARGADRLTTLILDAAADARHGGGDARTHHLEFGMPDDLDRGRAIDGYDR
jgi:hypothetical protein